MAVTLYTSEDVGAPQIEGNSTSTRGDLIAVLKACLVDGYGTQPAAGWTLPFEDAPNNIAVFRNDSVNGSGTYYRVNDNLAYQSAKIKAFENMTDVNTGTGQFPLGSDIYDPVSSNDEHNAVFIPKRHNSSATNGTWWLIACERAFYFLTKFHTAYTHGPSILSSQTTTGAFYCTFVGDIKVREAGPGYMGCLAGWVYNNDYDDWDLYFNIASSADPFYLYPSDDEASSLSVTSLWWTPTDFTGTSGATPHRIHTKFPTGGVTHPGSDDMMYTLLADNSFYYDKMYLVQGRVGKVGIRGEVPGALAPLNYLPHKQLQMVPNKGPFELEDWFCLPLGDSTCGQMLVRVNCDTADWYS